MNTWSNPCAGGHNAAHDMFGSCRICDVKDLRRHIYRNIAGRTRLTTKSEDDQDFMMCHAHPTQRCRRATQGQGIELLVECLLNFNALGFALVSPLKLFNLLTLELGVIAVQVLE